MTSLIDRDALIAEYDRVHVGEAGKARQLMEEAPTVDAVPVPVGGIGELSDGYHTFNGLYYQRMMLFAVLVKTYKDHSWKSRRHSDGEQCFGGGWFIVGIDTPHGSYTYHYKDKYFDMFDCVELPKGKEWDGHTEDDVTRLLSLGAVPVRHGKWKQWDSYGFEDTYECTACGESFVLIEGTPVSNGYKYCPNCGARMDGEIDE